MTVLENLEMGSYRADARRRRAEGLDGIFVAIAAIRQSHHLTILLVEPRVVEALEVCDRGYVLETGRVVLGGDRQMLLPDPRVQHAYLGA